MHKVYADKTLGYSEAESFEIPERYLDPCGTEEEEEKPVVSPDTGGIDKMFE